MGLDKKIKLSSLLPVFVLLFLGFGWLIFQDRRKAYRLKHDGVEAAGVVYEVYQERYRPFYRYKIRFDANGRACHTVKTSSPGEQIYYPGDSVRIIYFSGNPEINDWIIPE